MYQIRENNCELNLVDEAGVKYCLKVSPEDAARAENDLLFASRLLENAQKQERETANTLAIAEKENESIFKWSHEATLLLIEEYRLQEHNLTSGKMAHKKVWNNIGSALFVKGYNVTGPQCLSKYNGMKRTYKSIKDHNSKSGNNPRAWPYMEIMESLLGERPFMSPPAITSSSSAISSDDETVKFCSAQNIDLQNSNSRKKRKIQENAKISESIMESRLLAEKNKNERHKERIQIKKEMLEFMQKLYEKM